MSTPSGEGLLAGRPSRIASDATELAIDGSQAGTIVTIASPEYLASLVKRKSCDLSIAVRASTAGGDDDSG